MNMLMISIYVFKHSHILLLVTKCVLYSRKVSSYYVNNLLFCSLERILNLSLSIKHRKKMLNVHRHEDSWLFFKIAFLIVSSFKLNCVRRTRGKMELCEGLEWDVNDSGLEHRFPFVWKIFRLPLCSVSDLQKLHKWLSEFNWVS